MKKTLINILKVVVPLGIGLFLVWYIYKDLTPENKQHIVESFRTADYSWVVLSMFLALFSHISRAYRWLILLEPLGHKPKLSNSFFSVMIGYVANLAFPRLGEVSRCGALNKYEKIPFNTLFGTVLAERVIDLLILFAFTVFTIGSQFGLLNSFIQEKFLSKASDKFQQSGGTWLFYLIIIGSIFILAVLILILLRTKAKATYFKIRSLLMGFAQGFVTVKNVKRKWAFAFHTAFIWLMYLMMLYVNFFAFDETAGLSFYAVLSCFVFGSFGIIFVQGGIGAYPVIIMATLELYGISGAIGFAFGWLTWSAQTLLVLIAGLLSIFLISLLNKKSTENEAIQPANN